MPLDRDFVIEVAGTVPVTGASAGTIVTVDHGTINTVGSIAELGGTVATNLLPLSGVVLTTATTIGITTTAIPASALTNRKSLIFYNDGTAIIYLGGSGVTASGVGRGLRVGTSDYSPSFDLGTTILYGIGATVGGTAVILEVS